MWPEIENYLILCYGNTCRSRMLEAILNTLFVRFKVLAAAESAGFAEKARQGLPPNDAAFKALEQLGLSFSILKGRARSINEIDDLSSRYVGDVDGLNAFNSILVMDDKSKQRLMELHPEINPDKVRIVNEKEGGVPNPFKKGSEVYDEVAKILYNWAREFVKELRDK